jgi:ribonuclease HII
MSALLAVAGLSRGIAGVDDAGRGPIIGPLVIAGVLLREDLSRDLVAIGIKDSKLLSPERRTELDGKIRQMVAKVSVVEVQPKEIDDVVLHGTKLKKLNYLEARLMAQVIADLKPEKAFVDASDVNEERYAQTILEFLPDEMKNVRIVSKHHADRNFPIVSAASIIAKVRRDSVIEKLRSQYGDFGSGYITDPKTLAFLKDWRMSHADYPPIVRRSWKTIREIEQAFGQSRLGL